MIGLKMLHIFTVRNIHKCSDNDTKELQYKNHCFGSHFVFIIICRSRVFPVINCDIYTFVLHNITLIVFMKIIIVQNVNSCDVRLLTLQKPVFINVGRGNVISESSIIHAIR